MMRGENEFLADPSIPEGSKPHRLLITHNVGYQADDLDAYDVIVMNSTPPHSFLMADYYSSMFSALAKVYNHDNANNMINQAVQVMPSSKQSNVVNHLETEITSDSNIIPYSQYVIESQQATLEPKLYVRDIIQKTNPIVIPDSEETLMLAEKSHSKKVNTTPVDYADLNQLYKDFETRFVPQIELSIEQAFWSQNSVNSLEHILSSRRTVVEVPTELPKVSMVNTSLKKLKHHLAGFEVVVKERTTPTAITEDLFNIFNQYLVDELSEVQNVFHQMEQAVEQHHIVNIIVNSSVNNPSVNVHECEKCLQLETELQTDFIEKEIYDKLFKSFTTLEKHCISLEVDSQLNQEIFQRDNSVSNQSAPSFDQLFELNELKAQSQEKDTVIKKLKERINALSGKTNEDKIKQELEEIETINIELDHRVTKLIAENEHLKQTYKQLYDSIKPARIRSKEQCDDLINQVNLKKLKGKALVDNDVTKHPSDLEMLKIDVEPITPKLLNKQTAHSAYIKHTQEEATLYRDIVEHHSMLSVNSELKCVKCNGCMLSDNHNLCVLDFINNVDAHKKSKSVNKSSKRVWKPTGKVFSNIGYIRIPTGQTFTIVGNACLLTRITTTTEVPIRKPTALENETPKPVVTLVYSRKPRKSKTNVPISKSKVIQISNSENDLVVKDIGFSEGNNLYTLSLGDMMTSSPICLLSKASKTKSWLWHRRLSHLNFGAINHLTLEKPHNLNLTEHHRKNLSFAHGSLWPMPVSQVLMGKSTSVIVDDCSRFTWVKLLRSKDEAPDFIIKFLKMIQVRLKVHVQRIRTDNGTEFVNQTLRVYYQKICISHETSVARSPQQNGVVKRRNRTLIEVSYTMLIYSKAPLFLWAEAVATACYTQNRSIIRLRYDETPYELLHDKPPDLSFFHVFGALCYPTNDSENLDFDELTAMASEHNSSGPALHEMTPANPPPSTPFVPPLRTDWDILFQPLFNELLTPPPSVDLPSPKVIALIDEVVALILVVSTNSPSSTTVVQDAPSQVSLNKHSKAPNLQVPSDQSLSTDSIHTIKHHDHQISEHNSKWNKDYLLENIIGELARPVSIRLQLHEQALFCYYDAFLTAVEPKTYKDALTQSC
ncbi:retrovirus-related pol polyprotein from transposon TNT 1-94 [Tanacetum coccineum]